MNSLDLLELLRGPLFRIAFLVFVAGIVYRLVRVVGLGWPRDKVPSAGSKLRGVGTTYLKGVGIFPFIPWVKMTYQHNAVTFLAGAIFHVGLIAVIILGTAHMLAWKSLVGFGWPTLPLPIIDFLAAAAIVGMVALLINRITHPVIRMLSGPAEFLNWTLVFLPMVTGYMMAHHMFFRYEALFILHMLAVDVMLFWIPFSRLSHFAFYFFSRTIHGAQYGKRAVTP